MTSQQASKVISVVCFFFISVYLQSVKTLNDCVSLHLW